MEKVQTNDDVRTIYMMMFVTQFLMNVHTLPRQTRALAVHGAFCFLLLFMHRTEGIHTSNMKASTTHGFVLKCINSSGKMSSLPKLFYRCRTKSH